MYKLLILVSILFLTACSDKVAYVGYSDHECKYVEINGQPMTCNSFDNTFEIIWVDACLTPTSVDGIEADTAMCEIQ